MKYLNRYLSGTELKPVVLACREREYQLLQASVGAARTVRIVPLSREDVDRYVRAELARDYDPVPLTEWETSAPARSVTGFWEAVSTPWMLTLLVVYLRDRGRMYDLLSQPADGPGAGYDERILSTLMARYLPARVRAAGDASYSVAQVQRWTATLAQNLSYGVDFYLWDVLRVPGIRQLLLLSRAITLLIVAGYGIGLIVGVNSWDTRLVLFVGVVVPAAWAGWMGPPPPPRHLLDVIPDLRTTEGRTEAIVQLALGLVVGLVAGLMWGLVVWLGGGLVWGLAIGPLGLAVCLVGGVVLPKVSSIETTKGWFWFVGGFWFVVGFVVGPVAGLVGGLVHGFLLAFLLGLMFGPMLLLLTGILWWIWYAAGVTIAAARGDLPLRLVPFLEWCTREGILRRSGPAYQFRHLSLRDHLQQPTTEVVTASPE